MFDFSDQTLFFVNITFNALSLLSCIWLLCAYSHSYDPTGAQSKMVANIAISNCVIAITGFLTYLIDQDDSFYRINTILSLIGLWSSAFWTSATNVLFYKKIAKAGGFNSANFYQRTVYTWVFACLFIPLILTMVVFNLLEINYAPSDSRFAKSISASSNFTAFLLIEVIPFLTSILVSFVSSIKQIKILKELGVFNAMDISTSKLLRYPIAQCLVFLPSLICRAVYFQVVYTSLFLTSVRLFGYYLAGLIDTLVYKTQGFSLERSKSGSFNNHKVQPHSFGTAAQSSFGDENSFDDDDYFYREA